MHQSLWHINVSRRHEPAAHSLRKVSASPGFSWSHLQTNGRTPGGVGRPTNTLKARWHISCRKVPVPFVCGLFFGFRVQWSAQRQKQMENRRAGTGGVESFYFYSSGLVVILSTHALCFRKFAKCFGQHKRSIITVVSWLLPGHASLIFHFLALISSVTSFTLKV